MRSSNLIFGYPSKGGWPLSFWQDWRLPWRSHRGQGFRWDRPPSVRPTAFGETDRLRWYRPPSSWKRVRHLEPKMAHGRCICRAIKLWPTLRQGQVVWARRCPRVLEGHLAAVLVQPRFEWKGLLCHWAVRDQWPRPPVKPRPDTMWSCWVFTIRLVPRLFRTATWGSNGCLGLVLIDGVLLAALRWKTKDLHAKSRR